MDDGAPRSGDILIPAAEIAVIVNSCFWDGCPEHTKDTKSRTKWWAAKIAENQAGDLVATEAWKRQGWDVQVFWEHERPDDVVRHILETSDAKGHKLLSDSATEISAS